MTLPLLLMLVWNYAATNGPVYFEIWSSTNQVIWTLKTNAPCSPWYFSPGVVCEFFAVRARQSMGGSYFTNVSDWATR